MTDCSHEGGISLLSTSYKIVSNILLSRLGPYKEEMIVGHQCEFKHSTLTTDQIL
jgi:hypothetical protein